MKTTITLLIFLIGQIAMADGMSCGADLENLSDSAIVTKAQMEKMGHCRANMAGTLPPTGQEPYKQLWTITIRYKEVGEARYVDSARAATALRDFAMAGLCED